ncbi:MAG: LacI family DNA-binding transcriptional regulator [Pseudomonadota bacterium]
MPFGGTAIVRNLKLMERITIHDVARLAGVSIKTVSRVVNGEPNVSERTRERVERAVRQLNYRPNPAARQLGGSRSFLLGLFYDNPSASYIINVQNGVLAESRARGFDLVLHPCNYTDRQLVNEFLSAAAQLRLDGLILTPPLTDNGSLVEVLAERGIPFVSISPAEATPRAPLCVKTNDRSVCAAMTQCLLAMGHRRIAFLAGHPDHAAIRHRELGYLDALSAAGIAVDRELIVQGYNDYDSGFDGTNRLLALEDPPTAVFAANDDMAAGAMTAVHEAGLSVPSQISIAGFDDVPLAAHVWPTLTTIRQPIEKMASKATELLLERLQGDTLDNQSVVIDSELVFRNSTLRPGQRRDNKSGLPPGKGKRYG